MADSTAVVNLTVKKAAPGFVCGKDGKTLFGTDLSNPWGSMRHAFWPRCTAEGTVLTKEGPVDFKGKALFIHALQGMKPHHAAAKWNYANFQGPNLSAVLMEYTTPPSYGPTVVNVGGIAKDGEIITGSCSNKVTHTKIKKDNENSWPEPEAVRFEWTGKTKDGQPLEAVLETDLEERLDRIDVMAEVPGFVKQIVAGAAGTKPYIYQVRLSSLRCPESSFLSLALTICLVVHAEKAEGRAEAEDWGDGDRGRGYPAQRSHIHCGVRGPSVFFEESIDTGRFLGNKGP